MLTIIFLFNFLGSNHPMFGKCPHFEAASRHALSTCGTAGAMAPKAAAGAAAFLGLAVFTWLSNGLGTEKNIGQFSGASGTPAHLGKFALSFCCMVFK